MAVACAAVGHQGRPWGPWHLVVAHLVEVRSRSTGSKSDRVLETALEVDLAEGRYWDIAGLEPEGMAVGTAGPEEDTSDLAAREGGVAAGAEGTVAVGASLVPEEGQSKVDHWAHSA